MKIKVLARTKNRRNTAGTDVLVNILLSGYGINDVKNYSTFIHHCLA